MAQQRDIGGRAAADLVLRLSRAALGEGFVEALTSAQWTAPRYFSRANRFSRTVSAFAEFHATTRGTASQTVKSLIKPGYLARMLGHVARQRDRSSFGICASCAHLRRDERGRSDRCRYQCSLLSEPLAI